MTDGPSVTSVSLLRRIRDDQTDPQAWSEFVDRYGRRIFEWCLNRNLQPADAEDVTQNVLAKLAIHMETFEYDDKLTFRGWLRRMTENSLNDFFRGQKSRRTKATESLERLSDTAARADLIERMESAFDLELLQEAKSRVRRRVGKKRWLAWEMIAIDNQTGESVAEKLDMKIPTVYSSRYQVQKMIADEVQNLENKTVFDSCS